MSRAGRDGRRPHGPDAHAHRARDSRAQPRRRGAGAGRHPDARRAAGAALARAIASINRPRGADRRARHHAVPRRPDAPRRRAQPVVRQTEIPFSIDDKRILLVDDVLYTGPDDSRGARRADRVRPAEGDPAGGAGRPRPSRAADQGRLRRQEPADVAVAERAGAAAGDRRPGRSGDSGS